MAHQVDWTNFIVDTFVTNLREEIPNDDLFYELEKIMRTRARGWSRTKQCMEFNISMPTLDRRIKLLKEKYDIVQRKHPELPIRRHSDLEDWMDAN